MSASGIGPFDNDDAMDWLAELTDSAGPGLLLATLQSTPSGYLEAPEGSQMICAAHVVAMLSGRALGDEPEELSAWVTKHADFDISGLLPLALTGLDRVLSDDSELKALWQENEEAYPLWENYLKTLQDDLRQD